MSQKIKEDLDRVSLKKIEEKINSSHNSIFTQHNLFWTRQGLLSHSPKQALP